MAVEREALRDWHRLFGLLLTDFFTGSPFTVEVEPDLSVQQQFLDVVIVRRGRGRFIGRLPDGLEDLAEHNLTTFKSHREALDDWAIRELIACIMSLTASSSAARPRTCCPRIDSGCIRCAPGSRTTWQVRCRGKSGRRVCMIVVGGWMWCVSSWRDNCRAKRTTLRCTCSVPHRNW